VTIADFAVFRRGGAANAALRADFLDAADASVHSQTMDSVNSESVLLETIESAIASKLESKSFAIFQVWVVKDELHSEINAYTLHCLQVESGFADELRHVEELCLDFFGMPDDCKRQSSFPAGSPTMQGSLHLRGSGYTRSLLRDHLHVVLGAPNCFQADSPFVRAFGSFNTIYACASFNPTVRACSPESPPHKIPPMSRKHFPPGLNPHTHIPERTPGINPRSAATPEPTSPAGSATRGSVDRFPAAARTGQVGG
jgi:hypothetical protein